MHKLWIQSFRSIFLDPADESAGLEMLMAKLPKRAARRMSRLGIMLHHLLEDLPLDLGTTVIYGTRYSESNALETFLDSFPYASPTAFQTSIHPGGIEQALVLNQREIGAFFPLAGGQTLFMQMLKLAFSAESPDVVICGGEEKGGWLRDFGLAHPRSFAFAMRLGDQPGGACGELIWDQPDPAPGEALPDMEEAVRRFSQGQPVTLHGAGDATLRIVPR